MLRHIATVLRGAVLAQGIGVLALPVLTRCFSPAAFGHLQFYQSILLMLLVFATLRLEVALLKAENPLELAAVLKLCFVINFGMTLIIAVASFLFDAFGRRFGAPPLPFPAIVLPVAFAIAGTAQYLGFLVLREQRYGVSSNGRVAQAATYSASALAIGATAPVDNGIVFADLAGRVLNMGWYVGWLLRQKGLLGPARGIDMRRALHKFRQFPLVSTPGALINTVGGTVTPLLIFGVFSPEVSGQFALVDRSVGLPVALVVTAVAQVFSAQFARSLREEEGSAKAQFRAMVRWLASLAILPTIVVVLVAPAFFRIVFGPQWSPAGDFARVLAPAYFLTLVAGSVNMTLTVLGHQFRQMAWETGRLVLVVMIWIAVPLLHAGAHLIVTLYAGALSLSALAFLALCDHALGETGSGSGGASREAEIKTIVDLVRISADAEDRL